MANERKAVTGKFEPPKEDREKLHATEGFDRAMKHALELAADTWEKPDTVEVEVQFHARVDVWNPGGIGVYSVTLSPL